MKELTLAVVQSQLTPNQRLTVGEETIEEIIKLSQDPEYGEEFLDSYLDHLNVFKEAPNRSHEQYVNALKFFSLVEADNSLTDAYIKVFPGRYEDRNRNLPTRERGKEIMRGEASRFNKSVLVSEIRRVATIPVQLIYRHVLHEAIIEQANLMRNAKSEAVKQKAGACLIEQLKPLEDTVLKVDVEDGAKSVIEELHEATKALAAEQKRSLDAGVPLKVISATKLQGVEEVAVDAELMND